MKVLYILSGDDKYGAPKSSMELVGNLHERHGIEPVFLTCTRGLVNDWCDKNGFENHVLGQPSFMIVGGSNPFRKIVKHSLWPYYSAKYYIENKKCEKRIDELLSGTDIDLIHTNVGRVDIGGYYSRKHGIPHILHLREFGKEDYNTMNLRLNAIDYLNETTDCFIAISEAVKKAWAEKGLDDSKIDVVYNGIDLSKYPMELPARVTEKHDIIKVVFAGIISETKGQFQLIEAMKIMPEELRKYIRVDFYGGGRKAYIDHLKRYVEKHGLSECISFKGYSSDLPKILPDYDIGVVASRSEAFGRVTAEYMAAGLLVIASDTGANPEIVTHWKDGLIYEYGNTTELQSWLAVASACPEDYRGLRETAFRSVREKYSMDRCADEIYKEYRKAVRK